MKQTAIASRIIRNVCLISRVFNQPDLTWGAMESGYLARKRDWRPMETKWVFLIVVFFLFSLSNTSVFAADVSFSNAKVLLVATNSDAWGGFVIITLSDSAGNRIMRLCDAAQDKAAIALRTSDSTAKDVVAIALMAKASGQTVAGWGLDAVQGNWCGIGNFGIYP